MLRQYRSGVSKGFCTIADRRFGRQHAVETLIDKTGVTRGGLTTLLTISALTLDKVFGSGRCHQCVKKASRCSSAGCRRVKVFPAVLALNERCRETWASSRRSPSRNRERTGWSYTEVAASFQHGRPEQTVEMN